VTGHTPGPAPYCTGRSSSREIERATYEDVVLRVLAADQQPDHDSIAEFRQRLSFAPTPVPVRKLIRTVSRWLDAGFNRPGPEVTSSRRRCEGCRERPAEEAFTAFREAFASRLRSKGKVVITL